MENMSELEFKYEVKVQEREGTQRLPNEIKEELRTSGMMDEKGKLKLKGVSPKMLKKMKQEYVECPVLEGKVHFIQCFVCSNFQSRVMGKVLCKGDPIASKTDDIEHKFKVEVKVSEEKQKISAKLKERLNVLGMIDEGKKIQLSGVSQVMLKDMKQEYVECPVLEENVQHIECSICPNFQGNVMGKVLCKGEPITTTTTTTPKTEKAAKADKKKKE